VKLLILGASGRTGKHLVALALGAKHEVTVLVRDPAKLGATPPGLKVLQGDGRDARAVEDALAGQEGALVAVGPENRSKTTLREDVVRNVIAGMKKHGGKRLVFLSAAGVGDSLEQVQRASFLFGRILIPLLLKHPYADSLAAENLIRASGLEWVLVRASGLTNDPPKRNVTAITDGSSEGLKTSIPRADVARFMLVCMTEDRYVGQAPLLSS
jgi:uncharacterized protein YbjT (DUF2867 family)